MKRIFFITSIIIILTLSIFNWNIKLAHAENDFELDCISSYLCGLNGEILQSLNPNKKTQIASIVKLMTIELTFEEIEKGNINFDSILNVSEYASSMGGSQLFLDANSNHKLDDILKSVIVASANDSAVVLAETIAGSEKQFVTLMNSKAKEWGMNDTLFTDCTGLSNDHYSTSHDVAIMASKVLTNNYYTKYSKIWLEEYTHPSGRITQIANTNKLIKTQNGCIAGKTGTTDGAGYCLVNLTDKDDLKLISVILGAKSSKERFALSKELINYGLSNFKLKEIINTLNPACKLKLNNAIPESIDVYYQQPYSIIVNKNNDIEYNVKIIIDNNIKLPLSNGDKVGKAIIINNDNEKKYEINLIVKENVAKKKIIDNIINIVENW